jgi:hypothetical protein
MISHGLPAMGLESLIARHRLDVHQATRLVRLLLRLAREAPVGRLRLNRNRRTMLSLRGRPAAWTVSLHVGLLDHDRVVDEIPDWVRGQGRTTTPSLRRFLQEVWSRQHAAKVVHSGDDDLARGLPTLGGPLALAQEFAAVHQRWFARLPLPQVGWSRASLGRRISHIRFGSYRRKPEALVLVHPRLDQPWVAQAFLEHVLYHELCHHAQACAPLRGERAHSPRFRAMERAYPQHREAMAWERANLERLMAPPEGAHPTQPSTWP